MEGRRTRRCVSERHDANSRRAHRTHIGGIVLGRLVFRQALGSTQPAGRVVQVGLAGGMAHVTAMKTVKPEVSVAVSWWGNIRELREVLALAKAGG